MVLFLFCIFYHIPFSLGKHILSQLWFSLSVLIPETKIMHSKQQLFKHICWINEWAIEWKNTQTYILNRKSIFHITFFNVIIIYCADNFILQMKMRPLRKVKCLMQYHMPRRYNFLSKGHLIKLNSVSLSNFNFPELYYEVLLTGYDRKITPAWTPYLHEWRHTSPCQ